MKTILALLVALALSGAGVNLVANGASSYSVCLAPGASPAEQFVRFAVGMNSSKR